MAATWKSSPKPPSGHRNRRPVSQRSASPKDLSHPAHQATTMEEESLAAAANAPPDLDRAPRLALTRVGSGARATRAASVAAHGQASDSSSAAMIVGPATLVA